jgi:enterochelin esterase-like enzyme
MANKFIERAQKEGTPLIDGQRVTFVWQGSQAPQLHGDFDDWGNGPPAVMQPAGPDTWIYQLELPLDVYMEYMYVDGQQHLDDPFNTRSIPNGVGGYNQYFHMPQALPRTELSRPKRGVPRGQVQKHVIESEGLFVGRKRSIYLYQPAVDGPVPLVVVWDGKDFLRRARLNVIVDNLIFQKRIRPIALAMLDHGGPARMVEYSCNDATLGFLYTQVLPLAQRTLNLVDVDSQAGAYGVMGASMGGLMALYTGCRMPEIFGHVLSQSGAFGIFGYDMAVFDLLREGERKPLKIWLDIGKYDFLRLVPSNQRMAELLTQRGYPLEFREYPAGHNYSAWRDELWRGLEYLFGM